MIPDKERRVVIIGGGFAGTRVARDLESWLDDSWDVYLLTRSNVMTYNPLLPEVVGGSLLPGHVAAPIRLMVKRTRIRMVSVDEVDTVNQTVHYTGVCAGSLPYDHLVLAMGVAANLNATPGMARNTLSLKTLGDALFLRNRVLRRLEEATLTRDVQRRRWLLTFIVIGGGFSGVETAGQILDLVSSSWRYYRNVDPTDLSVVLLHSGNRLLPELSPRLSAYTQRVLAARGVEVRLGLRAERVDEGSVRLSRGAIVRGATVISTVGTAPHSFVRRSRLPLERGRIWTDDYLRVRGYTDVWAVGDCASITNCLDGSVSPSTAQFAMREARCAARNVLAVVGGRPLRPFSFRPAGQLAAIGRRRAVAEIRGLRIHGLGGWFLWRALYLSKVPTLTAKVRVFFEWTWAMFFPRDLGILDFSRTGEGESTFTAARASHHRAELVPSSALPDGAEYAEQS